MTSRQSIKGSAYERSIVVYLNDSGFTVDRTRAGWVDDRGDIHGVTREGVPFTFECKNHRRDNLPGWVSELKREISNNKGTIGAVVHKKHGTAAASDQYATLPLWMLVQLLKEAGYE